MSNLALAWHIDRRGPHRRVALRARIGTVVDTLGGPGSAKHAADEPTAQLLGRLERTLAHPTGESIWLSLAVIGGVLPTRSVVLATLRRARLDGALAALSGVLRAPRPGWPAERGPWREVKVVTGRVLVDLHHTAQTDFATGIQRVARQAAQRWARDHDVTLIGWTRFHTSLRELSPNQAHRALFGNGPAQIGHEAPLILPPTVGPGGGPTRIVPWRCTYVLPELLAEPIRAQALQAMLEFSGGTGSMIGFDCVPLTSAETTAEGMSGGFALMLAAIAQGQRIAAISGGAANEYRGWRDMLAGTGLIGPQIEAVSLPVEADEPTPDALIRARDLIVSGALPLVLVVGSHEPRKNHLAILHAAELLWREGIAFSLAFVGGNGWHGERFVQAVDDLAELGRPVQMITALPDDLLWAAYRLARCVVFPSLNEGFGLPVAEALATGTPVITSAFGSMAEIAAEGGTLLVNPRDDADLTRAMRILICDDDVHARLSQEAAMRSTRTWEQYAADTWEYLVDGLAPAPPLDPAAADQTVGPKPSIGAV
jgi:glycosyltransferase involved in cell wall biosynthesis